MDSRLRRILGACAVPSCAVLFAAPAAAAPVITELSPRPAGGGEWIEIHNPGAAPRDVGGWLVWDATNRRRSLPAGTTVPPGGYLVLAARVDSLIAWFDLADTVAVVRPSAWPTLNDNDAAAGEPADHVVLADPSGAPVDSVAYFNAWLAPERGRSLERVHPAASATDPASWGWSADPAGATPGRRNALRGDAGDRGAVLDGPDRVEPGRVPAVFRYRLPAAGRVGLWLVDREGRTVVTLREPAAAPAVGRFVWGAGSPVPRRAGPYLLCLRWEGGAAPHPPVPSGVGAAVTPALALVCLLCAASTPRTGPERVGWIDRARTGPRFALGLTAREAVPDGAESRLAAGWEPAAGPGALLVHEGVGAPVTLSRAGAVLRSGPWRVSGGVLRAGLGGDSAVFAWGRADAVVASRWLVFGGIQADPADASAGEVEAGLAVTGDGWWGGVRHGPRAGIWSFAFGGRAGDALAGWLRWSGAPAVGVALALGSFELRAEQQHHDLLGRVHRVTLVARP